VVAYIKGNTEFQEVIGGSFQALAEDSASKVDAEIKRVVATDRLLAKRGYDRSRRAKRIVERRTRRDPNRLAGFPDRPT
jgi:hypothetical protein